MPLIRINFQKGINYLCDPDDRVTPNFPDREAALFGIRMSTCRISFEVESGDGGSQYGGGTAFFVSPTILLTASHSALKEGQTVRAQLPGTERVEMNDEAVCKRELKKLGKTLKMRVVKAFFTGRHAQWTDLAILETTGLDCDEWVELDLESQLEPGDKVDVVGYPGYHDRDRMLILHSELKHNIDEAMSDADILLPPGQLSVSFGEIIRDGKNPTYRLSTTAGMSGGAVVFNGKVIGMLTVVQLLIVGVHIGSNIKGENHCTPLKPFREELLEVLRDN